MQALGVSTRPASSHRSASPKTPCDVNELQAKHGCPRARGLTVEDEFSLQSIFLPIHRTANDRKQRFRINHHLDSILFDHFVEPIRSVDIFQMVTHAGAPFVANSNSNQFRFG